MSDNRFFVYTAEGNIFYPSDIDTMWLVPQRELTLVAPDLSTYFADTWPTRDEVVNHGGIELTNDLIARIFAMESE